MTLPCAGRTSLFFPTVNGLGRRGRAGLRERADVIEAVDMCRSCTHRSPCRDGARTRGEPAGIWGGVLHLSSGGGVASERYDLMTGESLDR